MTIPPRWGRGPKTLAGEGALTAHGLTERKFFARPRNSRSIIFAGKFDEIGKF